MRDYSNKIKKLQSEFFKLAKQRKIKEAHKIQQRLWELEREQIPFNYNTKHIKGQMILKIEVTGVFGGNGIFEYIVKPKPNGIGFDVWKNGKKLTRGETFLKASSFTDAEKELMKMSEYQMSKKLISKKIVK